MPVVKDFEKLILNSIVTFMLKKMVFVNQNL